MEAIKIKLTVKSDTLRIPELNRFIGKQVEIILLDNSTLPVNQNGKFKKIRSLQGKISFDENSLNNLRQSSII